MKKEYFEPSRTARFSRLVYTAEAGLTVRVKTSLGFTVYVTLLHRPNEGWTEEGFIVEPGGKIYSHADYERLTREQRLAWLQAVGVAYAKVRPHQAI